MPVFAKRLDSPLAYEVARAMMDGFNRHYRLFRTESARAKHRFETQDWHGQQRAQRERIEFYDLRVKECSNRLEREFKAGEQAMEVWQQIKLHYIGLLVDHHQPELAETFFNSVTTKILHRSYFLNDFIFVRPAVSPEYIEDGASGAQPTYRAYYPTRDTIHATLRHLRCETSEHSLMHRSSGRSRRVAANFRAQTIAHKPFQLPSNIAPLAQPALR